MIDKEQLEKPFEKEESMEKSVKELSDYVKDFHSELNGFNKVQEKLDNIIETTDRIIKKRGTAAMAKMTAEQMINSMKDMENGARIKFWSIFTIPISIQGSPLKM